MNNHSRSRSTTVRALLALVLFTACGSLLVKAGSFHPEGTNSASQKTLTFADRVAYQHAVEEVYWRHRLWPKENPGPKPSLDEVMSQEQIAQKVEEYLRNSQLFAAQWQKPIRPEQLQAEIERMARHTRQPEVLRELFVALGNDPFIIAECLARPILSERLIAELYAESNPPAETESLGSFAAETETESPATTDQPDSGYYLPRIASSPVDDPAGGSLEDHWTATSTTGAPDGRAVHTAVWTGTEMIVWGGGGASSYLNTGATYNPNTDSWVDTTTTAAPEARINHTAVWTGSEMIVWGGVSNSRSDLNTGGRYYPSTDNWVATTTTAAPEARHDHRAVWTGSEMIVWGGGKYSSYFNTGGRYNPSTDSWIATTTTGAPDRRALHTAVWTGAEMIVWGGITRHGRLNTGGRYNPSTDSWIATTTIGAPDRRALHTAVWTGSEMIVWGGAKHSSYFNSGGRYNPSTDSWIGTNATRAPTKRDSHTAVWTGSEMIIWGGFGPPFGLLNTAGRYDPSTDSWVATTTTGAPLARADHTAVWTGTEMIVWGGVNSIYLNTGGRYSP